MTTSTKKLIIDTDPGVDDVVALLLALNSPDVDLKLISLVFGNCDTQNSLRNTVSMFHVLKLEEQYRIKNNIPCNWLKQRPIISVGMSTALDGSKLDATEFHGADGLCNIHTNAPQYTASQEQIDWFAKEVKDEAKDAGFVPSNRPSYLDILDVLRNEEPGTVTIAAIGPLQNIAKAAEIDPETFSRVKEVVVMGGALEEPGNVTPLAEFNVFADPVASACVYALTSPRPSMTLPEGAPEVLASFPKQIEVTLFPLDITHTHFLAETDYSAVLSPHVESGSPLAQWIHAWMYGMFEFNKTFTGKSKLTLHDALAVWYAFAYDIPGWKIERGHDIRVETTGQWTKGCTVIDRRGRPKHDEPVHNDRYHWLLKSAGNRVNYAVDSPANGDLFGARILEMIF